MLPSYLQPRRVGERAPYALEPAERTLAQRSPAVSSAAELLSSAALLRTLDAAMPLESAAGASHREAVLQELEALLQAWLHRVAAARGGGAGGAGAGEDDEGATAAAGGKLGQLLVSGSYLLGINAADSDVDAIFLGPRFVTRDDFFDVLAPALKAAPGATTVLPIATAATPIIELELRGVAIDLQFVALQYNAVPRQLNLLDDAALQGLDDAAVRGLNGPRVNYMIMGLVPNGDAFRALARALRLWARARGIYSNKMGFLGGINIAILSAYTCQRFPNLSGGASLLAAFFDTFRAWSWPDPVFLTDPYNSPLGA